MLIKTSFLQGIRVVLKPQPYLSGLDFECLSFNVKATVCAVWGYRQGSMTETPCLRLPGWSWRFGAKASEPINSAHWRGERLTEIPTYTFLCIFFSFSFTNKHALCVERRRFEYWCTTLTIKLSFPGDDHWAGRVLVSAAVSLSWAALSQLSHHLLKSWDLWRDKEQRHPTSSSLFTPLLYLAPPPSFFSFCLSSAITITRDMAVVKKCPGCDINSLVLVMWNKHQLTTHQSPWDSPILFRGEWIIRPNPNTPSAPWLPGTIVLGHTLHTAQITSARVTIPGQAVKYRNWDI